MLQPEEDFRPTEIDFILIKQLAICTGDMSSDGVLSDNFLQWGITALAIDGRWGDFQSIQGILNKIHPARRWAYLSVRLRDAALQSLLDKLLEKFKKADPVDIIARLVRQGIGDPSLTPTLKRFIQLKILELANH